MTYKLLVRLRSLTLSGQTLTTGEHFLMTLTFILKILHTDALVETTVTARLTM